MRVSYCIPGLSNFTCEGSYVGARITEDHFVFLSKNRYEGSIFLYDEEKKVWGMTNHPINNENQLDIPHNVVYNLNEKAGRVSVGIDYCSSGLLGSNALAKQLARKSMKSALKAVKKHIEEGGKR